MKPTHGLVPYTSIMSGEVTFDDTGPMTNNIEDNALMLEVITGVDGYDPRQYNVKTQRFREALQGTEDLKGQKIAVVKEWYPQENAEKDVKEKVQAAAAALKSLGANG